MRGLQRAAALISGSNWARVCDGGEDCGVVGVEVGKARHVPTNQWEPGVWRCDKDSGRDSRVTSWCCQRARRHGMVTLCKQGRPLRQSNGR